MFAFTAIFLMLLPAPVAPRLPNLAGHCQFGEIVQNGRKVFIVSEYWNASGEVRPNGLVFLSWTRKDSATIWLALYKVTEEGHLVGHFGDAEKCEVGEADICGEISGETLYWRKP